MFLETMIGSGRRPCGQMVQMALGAWVSTMAVWTAAAGTSRSMSGVSGETNLVIWASFSWKMEQVYPPEADSRFL